MRNKKRVICLALTLAISINLIQASVYSAPVINYDETMYVNMDYYGTNLNTSVVKAYDLNGTNEIVDFGNYKKVVNMSDLSEPEINDGKVTFKPNEDLKRFYFEGQVDESSINLPWYVNVSYKLNGVDTEAESLAGASGLIEINIDVIPNKTASKYFQDNMLLQLATALKSDDILSVEAQGAQMQTIGDIKAIVYMVMPGEEQHFQIRIGSDEFEFPGLYVLMMPATLAQLEDIKTLREDKEKVEDSAKAINESLDIILSAMNNLQSGLTETSKGLSTLNEGREIVSSSKQEAYDAGDLALESLKELSEKTATMIPHVESTKELIKEANEQMNKMNDVVKNFKDDIDQTKKSVKEIENSLKVVDELIDVTDKNSLDRQNVFEVMDWDLEKLSENMDTLNEDLNNFITLAQNMPSLPDLSTIENSGDPTIYVLNDKINELNSIIATVNGVTRMILGESGNMLNGIGSVTKRTSYLSEDLRQSLNLADELLTTIEDHTDDLSTINEESKNILSTLGSASDNTDKLIDELDNLMKIMNKYEPDAEKSLEDTNELLQSAVKGIDNTHGFLTSVRNIAKSSGEKLDAGSNDMLKGMISAINESLIGLAQTDTIIDSKNTVKNLIEDEWDKYSEEKMTFLNMDSTMSPKSFTSELNPSPKSIQVVMRTKEIKIDEDDTKIEVDENFHPEGNFFTRILNIFKNIFSTIKGIFIK